MVDEPLKGHKEGVGRIGELKLGLNRRITAVPAVHRAYAGSGTGDQARVNVQLIDAESGVQLWADRFDIDRTRAQLRGDRLDEARIVVFDVADARAHPPANQWNLRALPSHRPG